MAKIRVMRPHFPDGYVSDPKAFVTWEHVETRLSGALNYWLCSVEPGGSPHAVPKWGVWVEGKLYFDGSPETRHSRNIARDPRVNVHLESGDDVVILRGEARAAGKPPAQLAEKIAAAYREKYRAQNYAPEPNQWDDGGLYEMTPKTVLAWTSFVDDPTKFELE